MKKLSIKTRKRIKMMRLNQEEGVTVVFNCIDATAWQSAGRYICILCILNRSLFFHYVLITWHGLHSGAVAKPTHLWILSVCMH